MLRPALIVGALALLVAAGVVEGIWSNRWGVAEDVQAAADRLAAVPREFGVWTSTDVPIEQKILDKAEAVGSVSREYTNRETGARVNVLLLCGRAGPIGAHTPDICYAGLGYKMAGNEISRPVALPDGSASSYWTGRFVKAPGDPGILVSWAWGTGGDWAAAKSPRTDFLGRAVLYKLYVTRGVNAAEREGKAGPDPTQEFLADFLPVVKKALAPG